MWSETIDGVPIEERRRQEREINLFYRQLLENMIMRKTAAKKSKRIRAKKGQLRGATWHAARKGKQIEARWAVGAQGPQGVQGAQGSQGPTGSTGIQGTYHEGVNKEAWTKAPKEPGLHVIKNAGGMEVIRVIFLDNGLTKSVQGSYEGSLKGINTHVDVLRSSMYQKIKE